MEEELKETLGLEQPTQEHQDGYFQVAKEMWERASKVYELVDNFENREEKENSESNELKELAKEIGVLDDENGKLIQKSIGYMYNGVLVSGDISCRKGKVYRFRCQYKLNNIAIKKSIMKNLQEVEKKLTSVNLDILETLLDYVDESDREYSSYNRSYNRKEETAELEFSQIRTAEFSRDYGVEFKEVCKVKISDEGDINFYNENDNRVDLDKYSNYMLQSKMKDELKELSSNFVKEQTAKRDELKTRQATIKSKALNLLMLAEIDKQTNE